MMFNVLVLALAFTCSLVGAQIDDGKPDYGSMDIFFFLNEVEEKTAHGVDAARAVWDHYLTGNTEEATAQRVEISGKAQRTIDRVNAWINDHNSTGQLINGNEDCIIALLTRTINEEHEYLVMLEQLCGNRTGWEVTMDVNLQALSDLALKGKELYPKFLQLNIICAQDPDPIACALRVEGQTRTQGAAILDDLELAAAQMIVTYETFQGSVNACQKIIYEKIDAIELNVINGLRDCA